jgi:hypothetical protein
MRDAPAAFADGDRNYRLIEDQLFIASRNLEDINTFAAAAGFYELGEIRRLRGDVNGALAAFFEA